MSIDLKAAHKKLEDLRAEYEAQIVDLTVGEDQVTASDPQHEGDLSGDSADDADAMFDAEMNLSQVINLRDLVDKVDTALARVDNGSYGICAACGKVIDPKRMDAVPYAEYCLEDQAKREQSEA